MSGDTVADRRLHPATVPVRFLKDAPSTVLGLPAIAGFVSNVGVGRVLIFVGIAAAALIFFSWLSWYRFKYGVGAHEIVIEKGLLNRSRRSIPFDRIQDVDIERGPLARLFGLAKLKIETGAGGKDEGALDSVSVAEAERLRTALRHRGATIDASDDAAAAPRVPPIFAMDIGRVLLSGLFNFSLVFIAGLYAALQPLQNILPFTIEDFALWLGFTEDRLLSGAALPIIAAGLVLAGLLGVIAGVARTLARDYGFTLTLEPEGLRRVRGLFTRTEVMIPRRRVQLGLIESGPLRRRLGWLTLNVQTLSGESKDKGRQALAPLATEAEIVPILSAIGDLALPGDGAFVPVSRRHVLKGIVYNLPPAIGVSIAGLFFPPAWLLLLLFPLTVVGTILERRTHGYRLAGGLLHVRRGWWKQRLWIVPVKRAQTISVSRDWLQRRLGLATLLVDTAGAAMMSDPRIVDMRAEEAVALAAAIRRGLRG